MVSIMTYAPVVYDPPTYVPPFTADHHVGSFGSTSVARRDIVGYSHRVGPPVWGTRTVMSSSIK